MKTRERDRRRLRDFLRLRELQRLGVSGVVANAMRDPARRLCDRGYQRDVLEALARLVLAQEGGDRE